MSTPETQWASLCDELRHALELPRERHGELWPRCPTCSKYLAVSYVSPRPRPHADVVVHGHGQPGFRRPPISMTCELGCQWSIREVII